MAEHIIATSEGGSMYPIINTNDKVLINPNKKPGPGDVITFRYKGYLLTHRLIAFGSPLKTKGDNTPYCDDPCVYEGDIVGVATKAITPEGRVIDLLDTRYNKRLLIYAKIECWLIEKGWIFLGRDFKLPIKKLLTPLYYGWAAKSFVRN